MHRMKMGDGQDWIKVASSDEGAKPTYEPRLPLYQLFEDPAHQLILVDYLK